MLGLLLLANTACNLPVPRSVRVTCCPKSPVPKLDSIKAGTSLDDVRKILGHFETGAFQDGLFWARWYRRVSPIGWMGTTGQHPESQDEFLEWKLVNIVATSDEQGIIQQTRLCSEKALLHCLSQASAKLTAPNSGEPLEVGFHARRYSATVWEKNRYFGDLLLAPGGATLKGKDPSSGVKPPPDFNREFPLNAISEVNLLYGSTQSSLHLRFHLKTAIGLDWVEIEASPEQTWTVVKLLHGIVPLR